MYKVAILIHKPYEGLVYAKKNYNQKLSTKKNELHFGKENFMRKNDCDISFLIKLIIRQF